MKEGVLCVVYHKTTVVEASPDVVKLDTGGYRTATTKTRMNQAARQFDLGYTVRQKDYDWFVTTKAGCERMAGNSIAFDRHTGRVVSNY